MSVAEPAVSAIVYTYSPACGQVTPAKIFGVSLVMLLIPDVAEPVSVDEKLIVWLPITGMFVGVPVLPFTLFDVTVKVKLLAGVTVPSGIWSTLVMAACAGAASVPVISPAANAVAMLPKHMAIVSASVKNALMDMFLFLFILIFL